MIGNQLAGRRLPERTRRRELGCHVGQYELDTLMTGDRLAEHSLYTIARDLNIFSGYDLIYTDEDSMDREGQRSNPHFKPDWNPALMLSCNTFGQLGVFRRSLLKKLGAFHLGFDQGSQHDLVLRCAGETRPDRIRHIPRVLYHRRTPAVGIETMCSVGDAGRGAIEQYLASLGVRAAVGFQVIDP